MPVVGAAQRRGGRGMGKENDDKGLDEETDDTSPVSIAYLIII